MWADKALNDDYAHVRFRFAVKTKISHGQSNPDNVTFHVIASVSSP